MNFSKTFSQTGDFEAVRAAEAFLAAAGFSVGIMQAHSPRGILFGDYDISKWRNMSRHEKEELDGEMIGGRDGPVKVSIYPYASRDARRAFAAALAAEAPAP